jgi:hypothetical protein
MMLAGDPCSSQGLAFEQVQKFLFNCGSRGINLCKSREGRCIASA